MRIRRMIRTCRKSTGFKIRQIQDQNTDALSIHTGLVLRVRYDNIFGWLEGRMISGDNLVTSGHAGIKLYPEFSHHFFVNKIRKKHRGTWKRREKPIEQPKKNSTVNNGRKLPQEKCCKFYGSKVFLQDEKSLCISTFSSVTAKFYVILHKGGIIIFLESYIFPMCIYYFLTYAFCAIELYRKG